jgi:hypothetical protein
VPIYKILNLRNLIKRDTQIYDAARILIKVKYRIKSEVKNKIFLKTYIIKGCK